jgi:hypothetical protein
MGLKYLKLGMLTTYFSFSKKTISKLAVSFVPGLPPYGWRNLRMMEFSRRLDVDLFCLKTGGFNSFFELRRVNSRFSPWDCMSCSVLHFYNDFVLCALCCGAKYYCATN